MLPRRELARPPASPAKIYGVLHQIYTLPVVADLLAIAIWSLQGALFAAGFKRLDLLGVCVIGISTGLGGGVLRDLFMGVPPITFQRNDYLLTAIIASLVGMLLQRALTRIDPVINVLDAIGIGMFAAIGTSKALTQGLPLIPSLALGVITAAGGGVLRDLLLNMPVAVMHVGSLYAVAALVGSSTLVFLEWLGFNVMIAGTVSMVVTAIIRLLSLRFGWSLPEQRALSRIRLRRQRQVEQVIEEALQTGTLTLPITLPGQLQRMGDENTVHEAAKRARRARRLWKRS